VEKDLDMRKKRPESMADRQKRLKYTKREIVTDCQQRPVPQRSRGCKETVTDRQRKLVNRHVYMTDRQLKLVNRHGYMTDRQQRLKCTKRVNVKRDLDICKET